MLEKAKYLQTLELGNLVNVKSDMLLEKAKIKENSVNLRKLDLSKYVTVSNKLVVMFLKSGKELIDIALPFFSRITDDILLQLHAYLHNL